MITKVVMEALSPTMEEGRLAQWLKKEGDAVKTGDVLAEVETDKAIMELPARGDGILRKILVGDGETTEVGNLVAVIAGPDDDIAAVVGQDGQRRASEAPATAARTAPAVSPAAGGEEGARIKASPLARRVAGEKGLDLRRVEGSGPAGRIVKRDVDAALPAPAALTAPAGGAEGWEDVRLSQVRKTIARRLTQSLAPIPHFFLTAEVDMERAAEARDVLNAAGDVRISFNDIVVKVVAMALRQHRACNAWWQGDTIRYFHDVHIGVAVAIDEGLITPVIRHADRKSLRAIAEETGRLAERARARKLAPEEYTGSTFSISNLGMFGIAEFTAVINPPEAGILAVGAITPTPVAHDGTVTIRRRMRVTMSCDHRIIDGATGARFLQTVRRMLEQPLAIVW
ncbi:MAG TPA: dihydrolipoamide acetyltransferase family protein [Gemmatimonadales bacterium]|jgi:pyruvate dehydrogenase E2 component (dihydrolipoamide acetyltransferase)